MNSCRISMLLLVTLFSSSALADSFGGQVFYHGGIATLSKSRGGEVFTDTAGASGLNDDKSGWNIGAGVDLPMFKGFGPGDLLGEVMVDYARFSKKQVIQATSALLGAPVSKEVTVSELNVLIAPKYKFSGFMEGKLRPWIIPVGLSFLVNSPPSNNTSYLDIGYHAAVGFEYAVLDALSVGLSYRNTFSFKEIDVDNSYSTTDIYVGVNF